jgi:hypothetical protein
MCLTIVSVDGGGADDSLIGSFIAAEVLIKNKNDIHRTNSC